jgi:type I restriction enzyme S subunit
MTALPLGDLARVVGGTTPPTSDPTNWGDEIVWVTPLDLGRIPGMWIDDSERRISLIGLKETNLEVLPAGTVVMSSRAPIGHLGIARTPLTTNQRMQELLYPVPTSIASFCTSSSDIE